MTDTDRKYPYRSVVLFPRGSKTTTDIVEWLGQDCRKDKWHYNSVQEDELAHPLFKAVILMFSDSQTQMLFELAWSDRVEIHTLVPKDPTCI